MSWPIGPVPSPLDTARANDGAILLGDVRVTDADGWLDLDIERSTKFEGRQVAALQVRLRVCSEDKRAPFLYLDELICDGRRYASVLAAIAAGDDGWAAALPDAVHAEILARHRRSTRASSAVHRVARGIEHAEPATQEHPVARSRR